jgi:hypothetical protein
MTTLLPVHLLLVDSVESVGKFLTFVFQCKPYEVLSRPVKHGVVHLSSTATVILVQRSGCDTSMLAAFGLLAANQLFVTVKDVFQVQRLASNQGANIIESSVGDDGGGGGGGGGGGRSCVLEGPERIMLHIIDVGWAGAPHEYILNAVASQQNTLDYDDDDDGSHGLIQRAVSKRIGIFSSKEVLLKTGGDDDADDGFVYEDTLNAGSGAHHTASQNQNPPPVRQPFPTLEVTLLSENSVRFVQCPPNSRLPIPFETEFFKGTAMLLIRTDPMDDLYKDFFPKLRQFEVQVQGKFKRLPQGEIYVGSEALHKMELGFMTKSFCKATLSFAGSMVSNLHYSFGDPQTLKDYEIPHLVAPIFPTMDKILITRPGETPPKMGIPFVEDLEYRKQRLKFKSVKDANIDLETTYSFSVNTSNMDLLTWKFVNIPMCRPMDLSVFFGDSPIRLVAYEIPFSALQQFPNTHPQRFVNYVFNIVLTPIDADAADIEALHPADAASTGEDYDDETRGRVSSHGSPLEPGSASGLSLDGDDSSGEDDDEDPASAEDYQDSEKFSFRESLSPALSSGTTSGAHRRQRTGLFGRRDTLNAGGAGVVGAGGGSGGAGITSWFQRKIHDLPDVIEIPEAPGDHSIPDYEAEAIGDLRFCPATVEVFDRKKQGRTACVMFLLPYAITTVTAENPHPILAPRLRSYNEIRGKLEMTLIPKLHKNRKLSLNEKRRRHIVESYKSSALSNNSRQAINSLLQFESDNDRTFLSTNLMRKSKACEDSVWEGNVAIALSSRYWAESFLVITPTEAIFYMYQNTRQVRQQIPIESMVRAKQMRSEECPFEGDFGFLKIETLARVFYLFVKNERVLIDLRAALATVGVTAEATVHVTVDMEESFPYHLDRPPTWKLDKKMLYNSRRIIFTTTGIPHHLRSRTPCELVEVILAKAINLSTLWITRGDAPNLSRQPNKKHELIKLWVDFLDELSVLQILDIASLSECERAALFLNLFHVMVIHGSLVLGPPQTRGSWHPFFNDVAYLISFDVISIAEIEHNILRAAMSRPPLLNQTTARIPRTHFPGLALTHRDFRLNFCLNHGSVSMPRQIFIYRTVTLDNQLDEVSSLPIE